MQVEKGSREQGGMRILGGESKGELSVRWKRKGEAAFIVKRLSKED